MSDSLIEDGPGDVNGPGTSPGTNPGTNPGHGPGGAAPAPGANAPEFTVSEISGAVKRTVEGAFGHVRVRGEIGRVSRPRSGHVYLDLKDERAVLSGVIWKGVAAGLRVAPEEGLEVVATGRLTTFPGQSKYQIVIESLAYAGEGALLARLEKLRKALAAEGLFAEERKRALPYLPRVIGVVTSPSGAVIRDILHRLAERMPVQVLLWPVAVQGQACAGEVAAAIRGFSALAPDGPVPRPDVVIVARGGGSVEDLWGFNEEAVVRAAAASRIPLISAVGHETDTTLIDLAADRRAPTPSAAAEMAVPVRADLMAEIARLEARRVAALGRGLELSAQRLRDLARGLPRPESLVETHAQRLDAAAARLPRPQALTEPHVQALAPLTWRLPTALGAAVQAARLALGGSAGRLTPRLVRAPIDRQSERLADRAGRLRPAAERRLADATDRVAGLQRLLQTLGYRETLARGYAVVREGSGSVVTRAAGIGAGRVLEIEFADGRVEAQTPGEMTGHTQGQTPGRRRPRRTPPAQPTLFDET